MTDPTAVVTNLGSSGLLIYLVVKEALHYGNRKKNGTSGDQSTAYWELKFRSIMREEMMERIAQIVSLQEKVITLIEKLLDRRY